MAKFLTFETTALKLNDSVFPCNSVGFGLQANTVPVFNVDGDLLYYSPTAPIQGQLKTSFYLTGALPDFLKLENQNEKSIDVSFNTFFVPNAYLSDLSFSVDPFQPILVNTSFVFYHGLTALRTDLNDRHTKFSNSLKTLNGLSSYVLTNNRTTYDQNPDDFIVSSFNYSFSVDRQPVLRVKQKIPSRVALNQINAQFELKANNLDGLLSVYGNDAILTAVLRDNTNLNTSTNLSLTGIIVDQSYNVSESNIGEASVKLTQTINRKRNLITIPFEVEDYSIFIPEDDTDVPNSEPNPPPVCGCQSSDNQPPPPPPPDEAVLTIDIRLYYDNTDRTTDFSTQSPLTYCNGSSPGYEGYFNNGQFRNTFKLIHALKVNDNKVKFKIWNPALQDGNSQQKISSDAPWYSIGTISLTQTMINNIINYSDPLPDGEEYFIKSYKARVLNYSPPIQCGLPDPNNPEGTYSFTAAQLKSLIIAANNIRTTYGVKKLFCRWSGDLSIPYP